MTFGRKLPKTILDPKLAVESIYELYIDPQARLEVVFNAYLQTSHTFLPTPVRDIVRSLKRLRSQMKHLASFYIRVPI